MKKTVFNGIINGVEFDNVNDYNKEMQRLLSEGCSNIQAQSSTSIVDDKCEHGECKCEGCKGACKSNVSPWPGFEDPDRHFLDVLLEDETESYHDKSMKLQDHLDNEYDDIVNSEEFNDIYTLNSYKKDISEILESFEETYAKTSHTFNNITNEKIFLQKQLSEIQEKLDKANDKLGKLGFAFDVIEKYQAFYKKLYDKVGEGMKNLVITSPKQEKSFKDFYSNFVKQLFDIE